MDDLTLIYKRNRRIIFLLWLFLIIDLLLNISLADYRSAKEVFLSSFLPLVILTFFLYKKVLVKSTMYLITLLLIIDLFVINFNHSDYINLFFVILPIFLSISYRSWQNVLISVIGCTLEFMYFLKFYGSQFFTQWENTDMFYFLLFFLTFGSVLIYESKISESTRNQLKHELLEVKQLQGKLLDSQERYRAMVKQSTEGIFAFHPISKRIVEVNEEFCRLLGYEENELIHLSIDEIIVADEKSVEENIKIVLAKNRFYLGERIYKCKNGNEIIVEVRATLISFHDDQIILSNIRNITEKKKAEKLIRKQDNLLNAVHEATNLLLTEEDHNQAIEASLGIIGRAIPVDHVYLFENNPTCIKLSFEWVNEDGKAIINKPIMSHIPVKSFNETEWKDALSAGKIINGPYTQFTKNGQITLRRLNIKSVLIVPIFVQDEFWGFIGFSDSVEEKTWNKNEETTLMAAATNIGVVIKHYRDSIKLQENEEKYRLIADNMTDVVALSNRKGRALYISPSIHSLIPTLSGEEIQGYPFLKIHPDDALRVHQEFQHMFTSKSSMQTEYRWKGESGWINIELRANPIIERDGQVLKVVTISRDITERVRMEEKIRQTTSRLETLISHLPYGILAEDKDNKLILLNEQFSDLFGDPHLVDFGKNRNKEATMFFFEQKRYDQRTREIIKNREMVLDEEWALLDGRVISRDAIPIFTNEQFDGFLWQFKDITHQKKIEQSLKEASLLDGLTKISNRRYFDETMEKEWKCCSRSSKPITLIMLDIDRFKRYNDTYGHQRGDECLIKVAQTIKDTVKRPSDVVCRYGGEEFAVILPETTEEGGAYVAERIRTAIEELEIPHVASKVSPFVTCSLGVATVIPSTLSNPDEIIRMADKALYDSKNHGRNRYSLYD